MKKQNKLGPENGIEEKNECRRNLNKNTDKKIQKYICEQKPKKHPKYVFVPRPLLPLSKEPSKNTQCLQIGHKEVHNQIRKTYLKH